MKTTIEAQLPMPNQRFGGGIVVASVWQDDEPNNDRGPIAVVLTIGEPAPFYSVGQIEWHAHLQAWTWVFRHPHQNINHAVADYAACGGDA